MTGDQCGKVQSQAGKNVALNNSVVVGVHPHILAVPEAKPINHPVDCPPDDVLRRARAAIGPPLVVQIEARAARCYLHNKLRRLGDVTVVV